MGLLKRLHRVTVARIENFLKRVEDPEILFPQLLREMEQQLGAAMDAEAQSAAAVKGAQREADQLRARCERLNRGAILAVQGNDEPTARQAIASQLEAEKALVVCEENLLRLRGTAERAGATRLRIQEQLEELRLKKNDILARARINRAQKKIQKSVDGTVGSSDSILDAVARLEAHVEEAEAELEIRSRLSGELSSPSLDRRLAELDRVAAIDKRLAEMKQQLQAARA